MTRDHLLEVAAVGLVEGGKLGAVSYHIIFEPDGKERVGKEEA